MKINRNRMVIDKGYTDAIVLIGKDVRDVWSFFDEIRRHWPELLLGYNIKLVTVRDLSSVQGLIVADYITSPYAYYGDREDLKDVVAAIQSSMILMGFGYKIKDRWL